MASRVTESDSVDRVLAKSAQEMSIDGDSPPPRFITLKQQAEMDDRSSYSSVPRGDIPVIDLGVLLASSSELEKLKSALASWGTFQAINHGIPYEFLDRVRDVSKHFFALPADEKRKYSRQLNSKEGYGNSVIVSDAQVLDWCDRLSLTVLPEQKRNLSLWPPNDFRDVLEEYTMKLKIITSVLLNAMAKSLNLDENRFLSQFGDESIMQARFNYYPRCSKPDLVLGVKPHSDRSGITLLLQDKQVEGLQLFKEGQWYGAPIIPDALLVNLGDQMQIMSNGIFKSVVHRVVVSPQADRISIAVFNEPAPHVEIGPVDDLVNENMPKLYRNVKNYGDINYACFQKGAVPLDTVKL